MNILDELFLKFHDEFDKRLIKDASYRKAEEKLHSFLADELDNEKMEIYDSLIAALSDEIERVSAQSGIKLGADIIMSFIK